MNHDKLGFFARKYDASEESLLNIFKTPKIWGCAARRTTRHYAPDYVADVHDWYVSS